MSAREQGCHDTPMQKVIGEREQVRKGRGGRVAVKDCGSFLLEGGSSLSRGGLLSAL